MLKTMITGHRPNKIGGYNKITPLRAWVRKSILDVLTELDKREPVTGMSGMALGADQDFAEACITRKLPFIAAIPFVGQESMWPPESQSWYQYLLGIAREKVIVCEGSYQAWKMQKRNQYMVDWCDVVIAVYDGTAGGTANCVRYAQQHGKPIIVIDPVKRTITWPTQMDMFRKV